MPADRTGTPRGGGSKPTMLTEAERTHCGSIGLLCLCWPPIPVDTDHEMNELLKPLSCHGFAAIVVFRSCHLAARIGFSPLPSCLPGGGERGSWWLSVERNCLCRESDRARGHTPVQTAHPVLVTRAGGLPSEAVALKAPSALEVPVRMNHSVGQTSQAPLTPLLN